MDGKTYKNIIVSPEEREGFLTGNSMPANSTEAYIWMAFSTANGSVALWIDELELAAEMAERAGLPELAERLQNKEQADA